MEPGTEHTNGRIFLRRLELLAPAKDLECGIAAIDHGADAVYIGAPKFGARSAAGNSIDDIRQLCEYAHQYGAKVHVTVNTIIYDDELDDTLRMIAQLQEAGVDALLLQDMGVLWEVRANKLWPRELHSSTQCDARTADKVSWLYSLGFRRVVLARELSVEEIAEIHRQVPGVELEVFVHGALCVSYSGVCYASEKCFARSANRGECAQFCRMKFNLVDSDGREIEHERHLLSLKDLCQVDHLEELAEAGATSFKIEGRLKDVNYVKNVVAAYSRKLDELVAKYPHKYCRASFGESTHTFRPDLRKTFNRGYTHYFLHGRQPDIASFDTPKAMGEYVGKVKEMRGDGSFNVASVASFANGDGLCFINDEKELEGFRVNRAEGNRLYPHHMPQSLRPGMALYRNNDQAFEKTLAAQTATRRIPLMVKMGAVYENPSAHQPSGVHIVVGAILGVPGIAYSRQEAVCYNLMSYKVADFFVEMPLELAKRPQGENIRQQMGKLGNTIFCLDEIQMDGVGEYFIPNSVLATMRRQMVEEVRAGIQRQVDACLRSGFFNQVMSSPGSLDIPGEHKLKPSQFAWQPEYAKWPYLYNVANFSAVDFYRAHGLEHVRPAFELGVAPPLQWKARNEQEFEEARNTDRENRAQLRAAGTSKKVYTDAAGESLIMQCRHCIRYSLGYCVKRGGEKPTWKEPLFLELGDGRRFRLEFNCAQCQMQVYAK